MGHAADFFTCPACGKRGYPSRAEAKKEIRRKSLTGLRVYQCPASAQGLWHMGHLPTQVREGRLTRGDLGYAAKRPPAQWRRGGEGP